MPKRSGKKARLLPQLQENAAYPSRSGLVSRSNMPDAQAPFTRPLDYPPERVACVRTNVARMSRVAFASLINVSVSTL